MRARTVLLLIAAGSALLPVTVSRAEKAPPPASLSDRIVGVFGDKRLPRKLTPKTVRKRLESLATLDGGNQIKDGLEFSASGGELRWLHVLYLQDERYYGKDLRLSSVQIALRPSDGDLAKLYGEIKTKLSAKLGKMEDDHWRVNNGYVVTLRSGSMKNPLKPDQAEEKVVQLELAPWIDD